MESIRKTQQRGREESWPALPFEAWRDTRETLHLWTQIVGKVRMELSPPVNHWWHVALYVTPRGLTTSPIPYQGAPLPSILTSSNTTSSFSRAMGPAKRSH
jgi:hypothetical protein